MKICKKENQSEEEDNKDIKVSKENHPFEEQKTAESTNKNSLLRGKKRKILKNSKI